MPRLRWVFAACVLVVVLVITGTAYFHEIRKAAGLREQVEERMDKLVSMTRALQKIREQIDYYSTSEGVERLARDQFNLVGDGEEIYHLEEVPATRGK